MITSKPVRQRLALVAAMLASGLTGSLVTGTASRLVAAICYRLASCFRDEFQAKPA